MWRPIIKINHPHPTSAFYLQRPIFAGVLSRACNPAACDPAYLRDLCASNFTLAPAGDQTWSLRFFEAIMCQSIPIVADAHHSGHNDAERQLGYHFLRASDVLVQSAPPVYNRELAARNLRIFLEHQLFSGSQDEASPSMEGCPSMINLETPKTWSQ